MERGGIEEQEVVDGREGSVKMQSYLVWKSEKMRVEGKRTERRSGESGGTGTRSWLAVAESKRLHSPLLPGVRGRFRRRGANHGPISSPHSDTPNPLLDSRLWILDPSTLTKEKCRPGHRKLDGVGRYREQRQD